jgi:excisionase family DNA binding protein
MMKPDYSTWPTKQEAANAIGVSTKTVEKFADDGKLQQFEWKRPEGGPRIMVYHPRDVERLRKARNPNAPPFILPADEKTTETSRAIAVRPSVPEPFLQALAAAVQSGASQNSEKRVRLAEQLYLTIEEAAEYAGLGVTFLRRQIADGKLNPLRGAGPRGADVLRRTDLEALAGVCPKAVAHA